MFLLGILLAILFVAGSTTVIKDLPKTEHNTHTTA